MTQSFRDEEARRIATVAERLWGVSCDGVRVPGAIREQTLHPAIRDSALSFFQDHGIRWWTFRDEHAGRPTSLLRSSQVACVNHLEAARLDEQIAVALGRALGLDVVAGIRIEGGFLTYEWIGEVNYLREPRWGRRGDRCTSLDALLPLRLADGRALMVAIEWKYTESPRLGSEEVSRNGTSRVDTYRPLLEAPDCPIEPSRIQGIESLFVDPYTQLMRQTLLTWKMVSHGEAGADDWLHVHVVPGANAVMRRPRAKLTHAATDLMTQWRSVLKQPDRYLLVTPTELLAQVRREQAPPGWRDWLSVRYAT